MTIRTTVLYKYHQQKIDYVPLVGRIVMYIMYQSIPSLTIPPPPWANFLMGEFPTPLSGAKKKFKTPTPRAYKNELKPHPGAFFSIIHYKNMEKWDRNHVKLQDFIIFRWLKGKLGLQLSPVYIIGKFILINCRTL